MQKIEDINIIREIKIILACLDSNLVEEPLSIETLSYIDDSQFFDYYEIISEFDEFKHPDDLLVTGVRGFLLNHRNEVVAINLSDLANLSGSLYDDYLYLIYSKLSMLKNIEYLVLSRSIISDISFLEPLVNIKYLYLNTNIINTIHPLKYLNKLKYLNLEMNEIENISCLNFNDELENVNLKYNKIRQLPVLGNLKKLNRINLYGNPITEISSDVLNWNCKTITYDEASKTGIIINLNQVKKPPKETLFNGYDAIKNYFEQMEHQGEIELSEARVLIIGEPGSGKTTLRKKVEDSNYLVPHIEEKSTLGIEITKFTNFKKDGKTTILHFWDFGGQQIQYYLHQFFISPDALFIFVFDDRKENTRFNYWFRIIVSLGKEDNDHKLPLIIVSNQIQSDSDKSSYFDVEKWIKLYPEIDFLVENVNFSIDGKWENLKDTIYNQSLLLPNTNRLVPKLWVLIRSKLSKVNKKYITKEFYSSICSDCGLEKVIDQNFLLKFLSRLGVVIYFDDDLFLDEVIFLDSNWLIDGLYEVLSRNELVDIGFFTKEWIIEKWKNKGFKISECNYFLSLLQKDKFEIAYKHRLKEDTFIVPFLLPRNQPENLDIEFYHDESSFFRFEYNYIFPGIFPRLLVRLSHKISEDKVWQSGAIFSDANIHALVSFQEDKNNKFSIDIQVNGRTDQRRDFITEVKNELSHIHSTGFRNIKPVEMIPCNCEKCIDSNIKGYLSYEKVYAYYVKGKKTINCPKDDVVAEANILNLLSIYPFEDENRSIVMEKSYNNCVFNEANGSNSSITIGDITNSVNNSVTEKFEWTFTNSLSKKENIDELEKLKKVIMTLENDIDETDLSIGKINRAQHFIEKGDKGKALDVLKKTSSWVFEKAIEIGLPLVVAKLSGL